MSKKRLLLASAVLSMGVLASCGGGGGGTTPPPPPPPPPPATTIGFALVQAQKGFTSPGVIIGYYLADVKSNGTATFTEIPTTFDVGLDYVHEFSNSNILLGSVFGEAYLYTRGNPGTIAPITECIEYDTGAKVNYPSGAPFTGASVISLPHFVIFDDGADVDSIFTSNGKCVRVVATGDERLLYAGTDYVLIGDGNAAEAVYVIRKDGTVKKVHTFDNSAMVYDRVDGTDTIVVSAYDVTKAQHIFVIRDDGSAVKITNNTNAATGDDPMTNLVAGSIKIARDGAGNLYVAALDVTNTVMEYFKILPASAGSTVFTPTQPINNIDNFSPSSFALDGNGALYTIQDCDGVTDFELGEHFINASNIYSTKCVNTAANDNLDNYSMLAFSNGVLLSNPAFNTFFHHVFGGAQPTNVALQPPVIAAVAFCNQLHSQDALNNYQTLTGPLYTRTATELVQGVGTNTITCGGSGVGAVFGWIQVTGTGTYNGATVDPDDNVTVNSTYIIASGNRMVFVDPLVTAVRVCQAGATTCTNVSLSKTPFFDVYPNSFSDVKIKSDTNVLSDGAQYNYLGILDGAAPNIKAAYFTNVISSPYIVDMLASTPVDTSTLNIPFVFSSARGGNVNLAMDRVANVFSPVSAACPSSFFDHLWFKSGANSFNTLGRPANTCLINVLGTFSP